MARHGENIRKRNDGRWEGRYKVFDEGKGKHVYRSVYGKDYGEAKEKLSRARLSSVGQGMEKEPAADAESGSRKDADGNGGGILFSQAAGEWLAEVSRRRKYSTYIKYNAIYRAYLADTVGPCRLSPGAAQELNRLSGAGLSESMLSPSTQKSIVCVANQILAFANRHYQAGIPPLERKAATTKKKPAATFSRAEQAALLGCLYDRMDKFKAAVLLCLYAGLRLGELCALKWTDIDFEGSILTVNRTVQRIAVPGHMTKTILLETAPKSESSMRTIPLTPEFLGILSRLKDNQPYVFGGEKPLEPKTMQYHFKKILKEAGVGGRTFHTLRHTFATNCVENGMDVKALCEILGHSDVRTTLNLYVHPTMDSKRKQIGALSDFYGRICGRVA